MVLANHSHDLMTPQSVVVFESPKQLAWHEVKLSV